MSSVLEAKPFKSNWRKQHINIKLLHTLWAFLRSRIETVGLFLSGRSVLYLQNHSDSPLLFDALSELLIATAFGMMFEFFAAVGSTSC